MAKALSFTFLLSRLDYSSGDLIGGTVTFYEAGTTTLKTVYLDRDMQSTAANPYTLSANGAASLFGSGVYRVIVKTAGGVTKYDWDYIEVSTIPEDVATSLSSKIISIPTIADLRNTVGSFNGQIALVAGYYSEGDGGGGPSRAWDANSTGTDDGGSIIDPTSGGTGRWIFVNKNVTPYVDWFGAKGDGATNDTTYAQAAANLGRGILFSDKSYVLSPVTITEASSGGTKFNISILGENTNLIGVAGDSPMFSIVGNATYQSRCIKVDGFSVDLKKSTGFIAANGVYLLEIGNKVEVKDSVSTSVDNNGSIAIDIQDCFNVVFNGRVFNMHDNGGTGGIGIRIKSNIGGAYSGNITNIAIRDALIQRCHKNIEIDLAVGADTITIENNGLGSSAGSTGEYGIYISGSCKSSTIKGNHFELNPTAIYINNTDYLCTIQSNMFFDCPEVYRFVSGGRIVLNGNEYIGAARSPKYIIFAVNDATVTAVDRLRYYSITYDPIIASGSGTFKNLARAIVDKASNFSITAIDDNTTFTNIGSSGSVTASLPQTTTLYPGFRVGFNSRNSQTFIIDPFGTERIYTLTDSGGDAISNGAANAKFVELENTGDTTWQPVSVVGTWTDVN